MSSPTAQASLIQNSQVMTCTEQELTKEKAYHLLSPREGSDYREQLEGITSHCQWL